MTQDEIKTELSTLLSDTLSQIDQSRLTQAVSQAWKDPWVCVPVFDDSSLIFSASTYKYSIPTTVTVIDALYIKSGNSGFPEEIGSELWEVVGGDIVFSQRAMSYIPDSYTIQIRGRKQLTSTDTIDNDIMQNYVIATAAFIILRQLGFSRVLSFLKNDTSLAELVRFKADVEADMLKYRAQLQSMYVNG